MRLPVNLFAALVFALARRCAEQRITQIFVVCSIIAAVALLAGAFLLARAYRQIAASEQML
jgi:hypothetical protein